MTIVQPEDTPETKLNRIVRWYHTHTRPMREISQEDLDRWKARAVQCFYDDYLRTSGAKLLNHPYSCAQHYQQLGKFNLVPTPRAPHNWTGHFEEEPLGATFYTDGLLTRIRDKRWFEVYGQAMVDHMFCHAIPFLQGKNDYGEQTACYNQWRMADWHSRYAKDGTRREWNKFVHWFPRVTRWHKGIDISEWNRYSAWNLR